MESKNLTCHVCSTELQKTKTNFSLYFKEGDIVIKNYPLYICKRCGNVEISQQDRKKTVFFLKQHKKNYFKKLS